MYECMRCGFESADPMMKCPRCGYIMHPRHGWDPEPKEGEQGIWIFSGVLPPLKVKISLGEGSTPLIKSARILGEGTIYFKDESRNPTGSFRDRAAAIIVSDALSRGAKGLIAASDGNMGASLAAYAARAGLNVSIHVPSWTDPEKIMLIKAYGARVVTHDLTIDEILDHVARRARERGLYDASSTHNPLAIEGMKTLGLEIYYQLGRVPSNIVLPLGSGLTLLSLYHAFSELREHGLTDEMPRFIGVETCANPVYTKTLYGTTRGCNEEYLPGLSYTRPEILDAVIEVLERHGEVVTVRRKETVSAAKELARLEGLFVEPSSAVALAGASKTSLSGDTVIILTGHGLKGPRAYAAASRRKGLTTLFPGTTKAMILSIIQENPGVTGYDVWKELGLDISVQAVYQHLRSLEKSGLVRSELEGNARKYYITERGESVLESLGST